MMDGRTIDRLTHGIESLAAQALGKPARVLWLQNGESAEEVAGAIFPGEFGGGRPARAARDQLSTPDRSHRNRL
jgi:hypothetical protein